MMLTEELLPLQKLINNGWRAMTGLPSQAQKADENLLDVRDFYEMYWDDPEILSLPEEDAWKMGFSALDAKILAEIGIPKWAAPNMSFRIPEADGIHRIMIGEDREDRCIYYGIDDQAIYVIDGEQRKVISIGLGGLILTLILYAGMVELAIADDRDAFRMNRIPISLVDKFRETYCLYCSDIYPGGFIEKEVARLS